jgi:putative SOS response-associated peptidase YedK
MCGRYYIDDDTAKEIEKLVEAIDKKLSEKTGKRDVRPSEPARVLTASGKAFHPEEKHWGFPGYQGKELIINARSETALSKKTFRDSILYRRCIIPAAGFYEWNASREKASFYREDSKVLFIAGFYNNFQDMDRFIILTSAANESMIEVHDRMPLILEREELLPWLTDSERTEELLLKKPCRLKKEMDYEQLRLPF